MELLLGVASMSVLLLVLVAVAALATLAGMALGVILRESSAPALYPDTPLSSEHETRTASDGRLPLGHASLSTHPMDSASGGARRAD